MKRNIIYLAVFAISLSISLNTMGFEMSKEDSLFTLCWDEDDTIDGSGGLYICSETSCEWKDNLDPIDPESASRECDGTIQY